ncbi:MAG: hypothetical protein Q9222_000315 [Ikaeria aurantiellina]
MGGSTWQNQIELKKGYPKNLLKHAQRLEQQLNRIRKASKGRKLIPRDFFKHIAISFHKLARKIPSSASSTKHTKKGKVSQPGEYHDHEDMPQPGPPARSTERPAMLSDLTILVPIQHATQVLSFRHLTEVDLLEATRQAVREASDSLGTQDSISWIHWARWSDDRCVEVVANAPSHRAALVDCQTWKDNLANILSLRSAMYSVSVSGIRFKDLPNLEDASAHAALVAELSDANRFLWQDLGVPSPLVSVEICVLNPGHPVFVMNFKSAPVADKAITWGMSFRQGRYHCTKWDRCCLFMQCFECQAYGHQSSQCMEKTKCRKCAGEHGQDKCSSVDLYCANCYRHHDATSKDCPTKALEISRLDSLRQKSGPFWDTQLESRNSHQDPPSGPAVPNNAGSASSSKLTNLNRPSRTSTRRPWNHSRISKPQGGINR